MRTRTRTGRVNEGPARTRVVEIYTGPPGPNSTAVVAQGSNPNHYTVTETISDQLFQYPKGAYSKLRANLDRQIAIAAKLKDPLLKRSVQSDLWTAALQVHRCDHVKQKIVPQDIYLNAKYFPDPTHYAYSYDYTSTAALHRFFGATTDPADLLAKIAGRQRTYSAEVFKGHDWFALLDRWHEACNSFVPSSTLIGESIVENAIFVDAFKAVLNPSSLLKTFLKHAKGIVGKRRVPLGEFIRDRNLSKSLKNASGSLLSYEFGVKPAIGEIVDALNAHRVVQSRLNFLKDNLGGYVPVRVKQKLDSSVSNQPELLTSPFIWCDKKTSVASISALAKVREDLSYAKDWQAYVQYFGLHKFIGLAWELVPFSFVIDWFSNAGHYVNYYTTPQFGSPFYNLRNMCWSVKQELHERLMIGRNYTWNENNARLQANEPVEVGKFITSNYQRRPGLPTTSGWVDFSRLGAFQAITGSALLIQKIL